MAGAARKTHSGAAVSCLVILLSLSAIAVDQGQCSATVPEPEDIGNCSVLHLLNVVPLQRYRGRADSFNAVWDRGLEVIPAGHLAVEHINNRSDILPGRELKLIDVDSEACGINVISKGVANVVRELVNGECVVGVVGLFCSSVTNAISPIVSHPNIGGYVQIAASTAPLNHRSNPNETNLFRIIEDASVFNKATLALMEAYEWTRVSIVHDSLGLFSETIANDLVQRIHAMPQISLVSRVPLTNSRPDISGALDTLRNQGARISYWSVNYRQSANLLCEAYKRNLRWPGFVYIIRQPTLENILSVQTACTKDKIMIALEGSFLLQYRLFVANDTRLESGWNYGEYRERYSSKLRELANRSQELLNENVYANSLYDQVWSFAFAINKSLSLIDHQNMYGQGERVLLTSLLTNSLIDNNYSFQGASGMIQFGENQMSLTRVDIFQIQQGSPQLIAVYDPLSENVTFTDKAPQYDGASNIPTDTFEIVYLTLPSWIGASIFVVQALLFSLTTSNLVLIVRFRKEREVKASSPALSTLMILGCYLLCMGPVTLVIVHTIFDSILNMTKLMRSFCVVTNLSSVGLEFILATLFFRLFRIYHIFRVKQMTMMSDYWSDKYLVAYSLAVCAGKLIILLLWNSINPPHPNIDLKYISNSSTLPHYNASLHCDGESSRVWLLVVLLYSGILVSLVVAMAVLTRRIKMNVYKDTKKVNLFVSSAVLALSITIPLWIVFVDLGISIGANVAQWLAYFSVPCLCQVCIFLPKTLPLLVKKMQHTQVGKLLTDRNTSPLGSEGNLV